MSLFIMIHDLENEKGGGVKNVILLVTQADPRSLVNPYVSCLQQLLSFQSSFSFLAP